MNGPIKILVVDDDEVARRYLSAVSKSLGHEVLWAGDVETAWRYLSDQSIRIVLGDWWMPGVDGLELCRRLRRRGPPYVYFILVSNQSDSPENFRATNEAGVDDYLTKPILVDDLKRRIAAATGILQKKDAT